MGMIAGIGVFFKNRIIIIGLGSKEGFDSRAC